MIPHRPLSEESVLFKWIGIELGRMNGSVVREKKTLDAILSSDFPIARDGSVHHIDRETAEVLRDRLPETIRKDLRLPIVFFFDSRVPDSCYLDDGTALGTLQELGELSRLRRLDNGKVWIGRAIVYSLVRKYPTLVQILSA